MREGSRGDSERVWGQLPPGARKPSAQEAKVELAKVYAPSRAIRRRGDRTLEGGPLTFPQKGAMEESRTMVFVDESGFLPLAGSGTHPRPDRRGACAPRVFQPRSPLCDQRHHSIRQAVHAREQEGELRGADVVTFLKHLLRRVAGPEKPGKTGLWQIGWLPSPTRILATAIAGCRLY